MVTNIWWNLEQISAAEFEIWRERNYDLMMSQGKSGQSEIKENGLTSPGFISTTK